MTAVTSTQRAILACIEAELCSRRQWDEPPALYFITLHRHGPGLRPARLPVSIWACGLRPPEVLETVAADVAYWAPILQATAPRDLYGFAFRSEAWEVEAEWGDREKARRDHADALAHRLHARPDHIEVRQLNGVTRDGASYVAGRRRADGALASAVFPGRTIEGGTATGSVFDSLDALVTATLGVPLPPRPPTPEWLVS
jgi:hypothetical protein